MGNPDDRQLVPDLLPGWQRVIYFVGQDGNGIGVMNLDGSRSAILNTTPFTGDPLGDWHPDGNNVVVSATTTEATDLWILYLDGDRNDGSGTPDAPKFGPGWSPDGNRLGLPDSGRRTSPSRLHVADADGAKERRLPGLYSDINPAWSPDGTGSPSSTSSGPVGRRTSSIRTATWSEAIESDARPTPDSNDVASPFAPPLVVTDLTSSPPDTT